MTAQVLLNAVTTTQISTPTTIEAIGLGSASGKTVFQATAVGGTGSVSVTLEGSLDNIGWAPLATITLTPAASTVTDGVYVELLWRFLRANLTALPTGSALTATLYR